MQKQADNIFQKKKYFTCSIYYLGRNFYGHHAIETTSKMRKPIFDRILNWKPPPHIWPIYIKSLPYIALIYIYLPIFQKMSKKFLNSYMDSLNTLDGSNIDSRRAYGPLETVAAIFGIFGFHSGGHITQSAKQLTPKMKIHLI